MAYGLLKKKKTPKAKKQQLIFKKTKLARLLHCLTKNIKRTYEVKNRKATGSHFSIFNKI